MAPSAIATGVQIPGVLDDLYANDGAARRRPGPAACRRSGCGRRRRKSVSLRLYAGRDDGIVHDACDDPRRRDRRLERHRHRGRGRASTTSTTSRSTPPRPGRSSTTSSPTRTRWRWRRTRRARQIVEPLRRRRSGPPAGRRTPSRRSGAPEDISLYELHVRDFSINDATVPAAQRGTYRAFTRTSSRRHASTSRALARRGPDPRPPPAGVRHRDDRRGPLDAAGAAVRPRRFPRDSAEQQACVAAGRATRTASTGATTRGTTRCPRAATPPTRSGAARTPSSARWCKALNETGLRVVMDVVYNHTNASGQAEKSVLDRIVPGYYHRLLEDGTRRDLDLLREHRDRARDDGEAHGRLDRDLGARLQGRRLPLRPDGPPLEGEHARRAGGARRADASRRTVSTARKIYLYGEGWNFGEVANDARFVQATQANMAGTGIGTFNDRLRDAVRGGGPFDGDHRVNQGFAQRPLDRSERRQHDDRRAAAPAAAAAPGPDQGRPDRQPPGLRVRRPDRRDRDRRGGRLQRLAGRLHQRPAGGDHLRRGARQRDALRRARLQAAAGHVEERPAPSAGRRPEHGRARPGRAVLPCRHASCSGRSRSTGTASTPATGSTGSSGTRRTTTSASASRARTTTDRRGRSSGRSWPTPRSIPRRPTSSGRTCASTTCSRSGVRRRSSGSAPRPRSSSVCRSPTGGRTRSRD